MSEPDPLGDFISNLYRVDPNVPIPRTATEQLIDDLFSLVSKKGIRGWAHLAGCLFFAIARHHDEATARHIFDEAGPMPERLRTVLKNATVLERLYRMQPRPNVAELARQLAKENKKRELPKGAQRGMDGTDPHRLAAHIHEVVRELKKKNGRARKSVGFKNQNP